MPRARRLLVGTLPLLALAVLLVPSAARASTTQGSFRIYETQGNRAVPVRWNPCTPVRYRISTNHLAGAAAVARVRRAVAEVSAASGITFRDVGRTSFVPDDRNHPVPRSVGADLVISWAGPGSGSRRSALLGHQRRLAGVGGYGAATTNQGYRLATSGFVVFDARRIFAMSSRKQYVVALHELGHVLGLDDVSDRRQVMNAVVVPHGPSHLGSGDRSGLHRLGRAAGCLAGAPAPAAPTVRRTGEWLRIATRQVASVSGPVSYMLSSPELHGFVAESTDPAFALPLAELVREGRLDTAVRFTVRATNAVGAASSRMTTYRVPAAHLVVQPRIVVTPTRLDVVMPTAVLDGTDVDVTSELGVRIDGTVLASPTHGTVLRRDLWEYIIYTTSEISRYEVTGTVVVTGPGIDRTFDVSGTYLTGAPPDPPDPPTDEPDAALRAAR